LRKKTLYIKDNDEWSKDNSEEKMKKAIHNVNNKQINEIINCDVSNENYMELVKSATGSYSDKEMGKYENQIIKNVSKEVIIDIIEN